LHDAECEIERLLVNHSMSKNIRSTRIPMPIRFSMGLLHQDKSI
jgi:hypothetical protein